MSEGRDSGRLRSGAGCGHGSGTAAACSCCREEEKIYWCDICNRSFAEKRCPQCGMKLKRIG